MGSHFAQMVFIHYNKKVYFITMHSVENVLKQLIDAKNKLHIKEKDYLSYKKAISDYVEEWYGTFKSEDFYNFFYDVTNETYEDGVIIELFPIKIKRII